MSIETLKRAASAIKEAQDSLIVLSHPRFGRLNAELTAIAAELEAMAERNPHPDDVAVDLFAAAMKGKLAKSRAKGRSGWQRPSWTPVQISKALREHVEKGDPIDVANYCMFLFARNAVIHAQPSPQPQIPEGWEIAAESWRDVEAFCRQHPGERVTLLAVPIEPTPEMLDAVAWPNAAKTDYAHMLAAAPKPEMKE